MHQGVVFVVVSALLVVSGPDALAQEKCPKGPFSGATTCTYPTVDEGEKGCGPGAIARVLWRFVQEQKLKTPAAWGTSAQDIYAWLLTQPGWSAERGMNRDGMAKALANASAALSAANGGKVTLAVKTINAQNKGSGPVSTLDLKNSYLEVAAALGNPNQAVIYHTNHWNDGYAPIGHIFVATGISGTRVEDDLDPEGDCVAKDVMLTGRDDGVQNAGGGNDAQEFGPFDNAGMGKRDEMGGRDVLVAITIITVTVEP